MFIFKATICRASGIWNNFRGKFLIHASKNTNKEKCKSLGIDCTKLGIGMIIGRAILYDVKKYFRISYVWFHNKKCPSA